MIKIDRQKTIFLIVGVWNATFSYLVAVALYFQFSKILNTLIIGLCSNILAITMSFCTNKFFVFRTNGNFIVEYLKSYIVYGSNIILGVMGFWFMVDVLKFTIWLSQAILIFLGVILSYYGHIKFTFSKSK